LKQDSKNEINPGKPDGLVKPPKDMQYDEPEQMRHPLTFENQKSRHDI